MKQRQVISFKSTSEFNVDNVDFGLAIKKFLFLCYNAWEIVIFILTFKEITVFQCHNYGILSTLKQRQNFMLEQRWFWLDTKTNFVLLYQQTQNVESMSKLRRHVNIAKFPRHFDVLFWCNFHKGIIDVILIYILDIISMDGKSMQLQTASFYEFLKDNKSRSF